MANGTTTWVDPPVHRDYGTLRQSTLHKANLPGSITIDQANYVDRYWRRLGKLAAAGRL